MLTVIKCFMFFQAEVWGSVSDWVMIAVTAITIYFVHRTLRSQLQLQEVQMKLYRMEQVRLSEELRPVFDYSIFSMKINKEKTMMHVHIRIGNTGGTTARNLLIKETEPRTASAFFGLEEDEHYPQGMRPGTHNRTIEPGFRKTINFFLNYDGKDFPNSVVGFIVSYEDSMKNKYGDWVRCIPLEDKLVIKVYKGEPEMFDQVKSA